MTRSIYTARYQIRMKAFYISFCFVFLSLFFYPIFQTDAKYITLRDARDNVVEIPEHPKRIFLGIYFEDFFAVGGPEAYDKVIAISRAAWEEWRPAQWKHYIKAVPKIDQILDVGEVESGTFSIDKTIAAKPDLVILAPWQCEMLGETIKTFKENAIPVVVLDYNSQTLQAHIVSTQLLGIILGQQKRAEELIKLYKTAHSDVVTRLQNIKDRPFVYIELARDGADTIGNSYGNTMWGPLIELAGGQNIAKNQIGKWGPLDPNYVLKANPSFVFFAGSTWRNREKAVFMGPGISPMLTLRQLQPYVERPGWSELTAVRNHNVYALYHGGTRTLYDFTFLQYIAKVLHPDLFEDVDPQKNLNDFFAKYMPIPFRGTYMVKVP